MKTLPVIPVETLATNRNPGIVPPWLQGPVKPTVPVDDDTPRILGGNAMQPTLYEPLPVDVDPDAPRIWGRA